MTIKEFERRRGRILSSEFQSHIQDSPSGELHDYYRFVEQKYEQYKEDKVLDYVEMLCKKIKQ